ncbi:MAG TPA: hypothetical protein VF062_09265 [Candidatus Limnocylindrales bacterium]
MTTRHSPLQLGGLPGRLTLFLRRAFGSAQILQLLREIRDEQARLTAAIAALNQRTDDGRPPPEPYDQP